MVHAVHELYGSTAAGKLLTVSCGFLLGHGQVYANNPVCLWTGSVYLNIAPFICEVNLFSDNAFGIYMSIKNSGALHGMI